jgi:predicted metal-binding protein
VEEDEEAMSRIAILYCKRIKDHSCVACTNCYQGISEKNGEFARHAAIELVAMTDCGDCPGLVVPRVKLLTEVLHSRGHSIDVLHLGTCVKTAMETAACPIDYGELHGCTRRSPARSTIARRILTRGRSTIEQQHSSPKTKASFRRMQSWSSCSAQLSRHGAMKRTHCRWPSRFWQSRKRSSSSFRILDRIFRCGSHPRAAENFQAAVTAADALPMFDESERLEFKQKLAFSYIRLGEGAKAEQLFRELILAFTRVAGPESPNVLRVRLNLAQAYMIQNKHREAVQETNAIYPEFVTRLGPEHELTMQLLTT